MIPIIAIDTNIVIRAFKGDEECKNIISNKISVVSVMTEIELLSWPHWILKNMICLVLFYQNVLL